MLKTIDVNDQSNHVAKSVYSEVSEVLSGLGYDIDLISELSENDIHGEKDVGLTLDMSKDVDKVIRDGNFPFTIEKHLEGHFGESTGSSNVTTLKIERDLNIQEVLTLFEETGQLEKALEIIEAYKVESDPRPEIILGYALAQYAKGWLAEKIINQTNWFSKGSVSQDKGGIDGYIGKDTSQIGSITRVNSKRKEMENSKHRHIIYQWTKDGKMIVGDIDPVLEESKRRAKKNGLSATLVRKSTIEVKVAKQLGRSFRYLWW